VTDADIQTSWDVVIIGAGPAGLAACATAAAAGLSTLLLDENAAPGGQIYRAITTTPLVTRSVLGDDYWAGRDLVEAARSSGATILNQAVVWSVDPRLEVAFSHAGRSRMIEARRVIIATGALERPFPIPGWTLPGVLTVGAAQTLLKSGGMLPSGRTVIAGSGPLLWLYAAQALRAGGRIEAILDTTPSGNALRAMRHAPGMLLSPLLRKGIALTREVRAQVPVVTGVTALAAEGDTAVRSVTASTGDGRAHRYDCELLLLHQGVVPNVNLALAAGVAHRWNEAQLCWSPVIDEDGQTSVPGIAVAGDGAGIAGAWAAEQRGRLAAAAAIKALKPEARPDEQEFRNALRRSEFGRRFLDIMYQPARQFRLPADATLACRCEEVTAGEIRKTAALGCEGPNQMKALLRCGMGPCQGRMCGLTITELIAEARGVPPEAVGYFRLRPPVKPVSLAEIAGIPASQAASDAVFRR